MAGATRFAPALPVVFSLLAFSTIANSQCASFCAAPVSSVKCFIGVSYSNLPAGIVSPAPAVLGHLRQGAWSPYSYGASCASANVICNADAIAQGICTSMYMGATVTVQYPISTSPQGDFKCITSYTFPTCSVYSESDVAYECPNNDIDKWEKTCGLVAGGATPFNFVLPFHTPGGSGTTDQNGNAIITLATFNFGCAGEGLYYLQYCSTDLCNIPGPISTTPTLGGQCVTSPYSRHDQAFRDVMRAGMQAAVQSGNRRRVASEIIIIVVIIACVSCCCGAFYCYRRRINRRLDELQQAVHDGTSTTTAYRRPEAALETNVVLVAPRQPQSKPDYREPYIANDYIRPTSRQAGLPTYMQSETEVSEPVAQYIVRDARTGRARYVTSPV